MSFYKIETLDQLPSDIEDMIDKGHIKDEKSQNIVCNYKKITIVANNYEGLIVGAIQAYTAFSEIYIDDLWVKPEYRGEKIGINLLKNLENKFKNKGYNNINLVTNNFQAPEFYKKCGFEIEFVRLNKSNPKLNKTFFIKYFDNEIQSQGVL